MGEGANFLVLFLQKKQMMSNVRAEYILLLLKGNLFTSYVLYWMCSVIMYRRRKKVCVGLRKERLMRKLKEREAVE